VFGAVQVVNSAAKTFYMSAGDVNILCVTCKLILYFLITAISHYNTASTEEILLFLTSVIFTDSLSALQSLESQLMHH